MATILGTSGSNVINGTNDPGDVIFARAGNDLVNANAGNDLVFGELGNDVLVGGLGDDRLNGGLGNDTLNGGAGIDTADYSSGAIDPPGPIGPQPIIGATAGVTVNLNLLGAQNTGGGGIDQLLSIENLFGTNFNDILTGNGVNNVLSSLGGNDSLNGGAGNDTLNGGLGNDTLNGGTGIDTASYTSATANVSVNLNLVGAQFTGGGGIDQLVSIENLTGSRFNDVLTGNAGNNVLTGGGGNDLLNGGGGNNTASYATATAGVVVGIDTSPEGNEGVPQNTGGAGIDTLVDIRNLIGSTFNDSLWGYELGGTLDGGDGNDSLFAADSAVRLNGGAGNDRLHISESIGGFDGTSTLNGGAGADRLEDSSFDHLNYTTSFDYNAVSDSPAGAGRDAIVGFHGEGTLQGDQIDLRDIYPGTLIWGGLWTAGHVRYVGGVVQVNTDSDTAAEFEIQLVGTPALTVGGVGTDILL
jgi:Ca2+-binding RTX toxin-like protein